MEDAVVDNILTLSQSSIRDLLHQSIRLTACLIKGLEEHDSFDIEDSSKLQENLKVTDLLATKFIKQQLESEKGKDEVPCVKDEGPCVKARVPCVDDEAVIDRKETLRRERKEVCDRLVTEIVQPLLRLNADGAIQDPSVASLAVALLQDVVEAASPCVVSRLTELGVQYLRNYDSEKSLSYIKSEHSGANSVLVVIDTLSVLVSGGCLSESTFNLVHQEVLKSYWLAGDKIIGRILGLLVPALYKQEIFGSRQRITELWEVIWAIYEKHGQKTFKPNLESSLSERPFLLLCGLANVFFPVSGFCPDVIRLLSEESFWGFIQTGLFHTPALTRKRAMYLLKRILDIVQTNQITIGKDQVKDPKCLFFWDCNNREESPNVWQDFILLMETLEEKQVHVIKPLMPRLQKLIDATTGDRAVLHSSWVVCAVQRAACHESPHIQRWGVHEILNIDFSRCPMFEQEQAKFFTGPFINMLMPSTLYYKHAVMELGASPVLASSLVTFFQSCHKQLDSAEREKFFFSFVEAVSQQQWSGAPLVYLMRGLASVPPAPVWGPEIFQHIRELLSVCTNTVNVHFRAAIQCYLIKAFVKMTDMCKVGPSDLAPLIASLPHGEVIQRGTVIWDELTRWLSEATHLSPQWESESITQWLQTGIQTYLTVQAGPDGDSKSSESMEASQFTCAQATRLLLLAADSGLLRRDAHTGCDPLVDLVRPMREIILSVNSHAYMSTDKVDKALVFFTSLVQESILLKGSSAGDALSETMRKLCEDCAGDILLYIQRRVSEISTPPELEKMAVYTDILGVLAVQTGPTLSEHSGLTTLVSTCVELCQSRSSSLTLHCAMAILGSLASLLQSCNLKEDAEWILVLLQSFRGWSVVQSLPKPPGLQVIGGRKACTDQFTWGHVATAFLGHQWSCIHLMLSIDGEASSVNAAGLVDACLDSLDLVTGDAIIPILQCLQLLLPRLQEEQSVVSAFQVCWRKVTEKPKLTWFRSVYSMFIDMVFQAEFLEKPADSPVHGFLSDCCEEIFALGEEKLGVVNVLITKLCAWMASTADNVKDAEKFLGVLMKAVLFGPVHSRGYRFMNEVHQFIVKQGDQLSVNQLVHSTAMNDSLVRVTMCAFLAGLSTQLPQHCQFVDALINKLIAEHRSLIDVGSYKNFPNCLTHRQKHRVVSTLLLLQVFVNETNISEVFAYLREMLGREAQPSIRCLLEWVTVLLINRWQHLMDNIWQQIREGTEKKNIHLCSLFTIVAHTAKLISDKKQLATYCLRGLSAVLPWCMCHNFNVRVFAQVSLITMWEVCQQQQLDEVLTQHCLVDSFIQHQAQEKKAWKYSHKLLDNFIFKFHPLRDYSIETILHTLPKLTCLSDEEWLHPELFLPPGGPWTQPDAAHHLPLYNSDQQMRNSTPGTWKIRQGPEDANLDLTDGDVQKKMIPWLQMMPENDLDLGLQDEYTKKKQTMGGLVLVTSLIDKIPNLGGLCRTCEIFGVSEYVIGNMRNVEERDFENLSVTAHKWIPIKEVQPKYLKAYLLEMKSEGYILVGAEQTAQSQCLTSYHFPKKTLLLLGNEKEGIPVDLIQLLDVCVEIPQQGIIRSLNVHVSGALLIWEYTRQQLIAAMP